MKNTQQQRINVYHSLNKMSLFPRLIFLGMGVGILVYLYWDISQDKYRLAAHTHVENTENAEEVDDYEQETDEQEPDFIDELRQDQEADEKAG